MENNFTDTELTNEVWRDIDGYDGMYQVSDLGRVRSKKYGYWRVMRPETNMKGYLILGLSKDNKKRSFSVHRLVADAFIPNDDDSKTQINHRNEIKTDNKVSNLEYCTAQYNTTYNDIHHRRWINRNDYKYPKIKKLYNPDLTIKQNLEIFRANGIECCRNTVIQLRKDLGLTRKYINRDKFKDLYRPELTINENLKMFKEQGIECSEWTVKQLRKDLGLSKPRKYTKRS